MPKKVWLVYRLYCYEDDVVGVWTDEEKAKDQAKLVEDEKHTDGACVVEAEINKDLRVF